MTGIGTLVGRARQLLRRWTPSPERDSSDAPTVPVGELFRRFWPLTRGRRRSIAVVLILAALGPVLATATITLYGRLVDEVLVPRRLEPLGTIAALYVAIALAAGVVGFARSYLSTWVSQHLLLDLRLDVFDHLQTLPLDYFDRRRLGDTITRLTDDVDGIETLVVSGFSALVNDILKIVLFTAALFVIDAQLAVVALVVAPPFWLAARRFASKIKQVAREQRFRDGTMLAVAEESLGSAALVRAYNREAVERERFAAELRSNLTAQLALARLRALFSPLGDLIELGGVLVVVSVGAWSLAEGRISLGDLLAFLAFLSQLYAPVRGLGRLATSAVAAAAAAERVIEVLDVEPRVRERAEPIALRPARGAIAFEDVSYRYPGADRDALSNASFRVEPGEVVALVGPSGSGKSTIARLLVRFDDPTGGRITLDDHDLRTLSLASLRENVTLLLQETMVVAGSVREVIAFGKPGASDAEIRAAAARAEADPFIRALPGGYDGAVGERGRTLSGGQRQRLALARAMLRGSPVLVLDEPTTGLDPEVASRVLSLARRATDPPPAVVLITHSLASVKEADRIVVLDGGRVVEQGRHHDLLAAGGRYAALAWAEARAGAERSAAAGSLPETGGPTDGVEQSAAVRGR